MVDDGSTDRTSEIVREIIDRPPPGLPPLRLIRQENSGKPVALNTGTRHARGDILVLLERPTALWTLPLQQAVYRQLMYLVVIHSVVTAVVGARLRWQRMDRHGSLSVPTQASGSR